MVAARDAQRTRQRDVVVALDLEDVRGRGTLLDLAAGADLVIESFGPGAMQRLGLGLEALQARNPALSLVSISPWGGTSFTKKAGRPPESTSVTGLIAIP